MYTYIYMYIRTRIYMYIRIYTCTCEATLDRWTHYKVIIDHCMPFSCRVYMYTCKLFFCCNYTYVYIRIYMYIYVPRFLGICAFYRMRCTSMNSKIQGMTHMYVSVECTYTCTCSYALTCTYVHVHVHVCMCKHKMHNFILHTTSFFESDLGSFYM